MKVAVLTSKNQWFVPYAQNFAAELPSELYFHHTDVPPHIDVLLILAYHEVIPEKTLSMSNFNLVVHESALPEGRGWSPLFWQILRGMDTITVSLVEASKKVDSGRIYLQSEIHFTGLELHDEIRSKQAKVTTELCLKFLQSLERGEDLEPWDQQGTPTYFPKRNPEDSELDFGRSLEEQFDLLRICCNHNYPAYFIRDGKKYIIKIEEADL